jgi:hypothetical protein
MLIVFSVFKLKLVISSLNLSIFGARQYLGAKNYFLKMEVASHSKIK